MRPVIVALGAVGVLVVAGCSSHPAPAKNVYPSSFSQGISVEQECVALYGGATQTVGTNGQGATGWTCVVGTAAHPFTAANMQNACDRQFPGTKAANMSTGNSGWRCVAK